MSDYTIPDNMVAIREDSRFYHQSLTSLMENATTSADGSWLDKFSDLTSSACWKVTGHIPATNIDTIRSHRMFNHAVACRDFNSYILSAAIWAGLECTKYKDTPVRSSISRLLEMCSGKSELSEFLLKEIADKDKQDASEYYEHSIELRTSVFRKCVELTLFPKTVIDPWRFGKGKSSELIYGQYVKGCGIYAPGNAFSVSTLVPKLMSDTDTGDYRKPVRRADLGPLASDKTIRRCLNTLKDIGWISVKVVSTYGSGNLRFITPNIFNVIKRLETWEESTVN